MKTPFLVSFRVLRVVGTLWSGARATHEYTLKEDQNPASLADAKRIAGDFESLSTARIYSTRREGIETLASKLLK